MGQIHWLTTEAARRWKEIGSFWTTAKNTAIPDSSPTAVLGDRPETFNLAHEEEGRPASTALYPMQGTREGRRTRCTKLNQAREGRQQSEETVIFQQKAYA